MRNNFYAEYRHRITCNKCFLGNEQFKSHYKEEELRQGDDHKNFVHAFNAYAPAGTVTGQLVYVNYAR